MAIRRDVFEKAAIAEAWDTAVSDDFTFTLGVRRLGLKVRFVPDCIAVSYEASSFRQTMEFTNRQSIISRVYFPPLWWSTAIGHAIANFLLLYGLVALVLWLWNGDTHDLIGAGCIILLPFQLANAAWLFRMVKELLPQLREQLETLRWYYVFTAPLASLLTLVNTLYSLTTRQITWRGIRYELRSPRQTIVLPHDV